LNNPFVNLRRLFSSLDAFDEPFRDSITSRILLYPTAGYILKEEQFKAIAAASADVGEDSAQCVITEGLTIDGLPSELECYPVPLNSYGEYKTLTDSFPIMQENAMISVSGAWGLLISQEFHAVLGGSEHFINAFKRTYLAADSDMANFVLAWEGNAHRIGSDISWMARLLNHIKQPSPH
jgi:hypothetical protein